jgi:hypothetical protein
LLSRPFQEKQLDRLNTYCLALSIPATIIQQEKGVKMFGALGIPRVTNEMPVKTKTTLPRITHVFGL